MAPELTTLHSIHTFKQLTNYLRDQLGWPIESDDFEELTFDYAPEELGLDKATAVKIKEIKQLRPLSNRQPWGIFFVSFEPKRLPVVVMRRILSTLVIKKRQSANRAQQAAWRLHDLLFISSYGEADHRDITFAHFAEESGMGDLPVLRLLGWDDEDTKLHVDHVERELKSKLHWPADEQNVDSWRTTWSSAFKLRPREVIKTSQQLAIRLADLARGIRRRMNAVLAIESGNGQLRKLYAAFKQALIHDLSEDDFADMYAQTISYGLLTARVSRPAGLVADNLTDMVPVTNPFLKELLEMFLTVGGRKGKIDFDELGVNEVVQMLRDADMAAVLRDFGDRNPQEDPVIHFYELFLKEYDAKKRMQRGVFYTPRPVVSFIVRSVDEILRKEFKLEDGLADISTWGEMTQRNKGLQHPAGVTPDQPFVQILDPAVGTGTFLVEAIDVIHRTMEAKWRKQGYIPLEFQRLWNEYVPKHLLPRLHGFELMMAPYAIAHMKIGLKLFETGYHFDSKERARVYLTNSLEPASDHWKQREFEEWAPALANEAIAANRVKSHQRFTVILGNPPYSVISANFNSFVDSLMADYKRHVKGEQGLVALADDYLKFIRVSQYLLQATGAGCWAMITNHGYLKGIIHRGVRTELLNQFKRLFVLNLHGDSNIGEAVPKGMSNENVFDIQQGVAISIGTNCSVSHPNTVEYADAWGTREEKYRSLISQSISQREWMRLTPAAPNFFFVPFDSGNLAEYQKFPSIDDLLPVNSCGVKTHRDAVVIDFDKKALISRIKDIASEHRLEILRERYGIEDTPHWALKDAQRKIKDTEVETFIHRVTYRPFDNRWIYYNPAIIEKGDSKYPTLRHFLGKNLGLLTSRIQATGAFDAVFISRFLVEMKTAESSRSSTVFPLFLKTDQTAQGRLVDTATHANLSPAIVKDIADRLGIKGEEIHRSPVIAPENILNYIYGMLHSPGYRTRYGEYLTIGFPRIPLPGSLALFSSVAELGGELVSLHLLESTSLDEMITGFVGAGSPEVEKITWSNKTVWIDKAEKLGFTGVREEVWNFRIGGYQVCEKWLKDRKGRKLLKADIEHYQKVVAAINETIRLMKEIDEVINEHGGWPGAFASSRE